MLTNGIGAVVLNHGVLNAAFEDQITPINGAVTIFNDDTVQPDALSFRDATAPYRVVFLAFPLEAYGNSTDKSDLITRVITFFNAP